MPSSVDSKLIKIVIASALALCISVAFFMLGDNKEIESLNGLPRHQQLEDSVITFEEQGNLHVESVKQFAGKQNDEKHVVKVRDSLNLKELSHVTISLRQSPGEPIATTGITGIARIPKSIKELSELRFKLPAELGGDGQYLAADSITITAENTLLVKIAAYARVRLFFDNTDGLDKSIPVVFLDNRPVRGSIPSVQPMRRMNPKVWLRFVRNDHERNSPTLEEARNVNPRTVSLIDLPHSGEVAILGQSKKVLCEPIFLTIRAGIESRATIRTKPRSIVWGRLIETDSGDPLPNWLVSVAASTIFEPGQSIPSDRQMGTSQRIREDGSVQSILLTQALTNKDGKFKLTMPFTGSLAIWNDDKHTHSLGYSEFSLGTMKSNSGELKIQVHKIKSRRFMQLVLNGEKVKGLNGVKAIPIPRSPYAMRFALKIDPEGKLDISRLPIGKKYKLAGFLGRSDLQSFVEFRCEPNGIIELKKSR